jgi:sulfide:quinone oxidoreductase
MTDAASPPPGDLHSEILIVGAGSAGISVAARLRKAHPPAEVTILDPSTRHYYQPLWTLVGAGVVSKEKTVREQERLIPAGARWIRERAAAFHPDRNTVVTDAGRTLTYDYLVVCPGIQMDWDAIPGLVETLGRNGVCSNYAYDQVDYTWETLQAVARKPGQVRALFTQPAGVFKCGGAPQKILYLAADHLRRTGKLPQAEVHFFHPGKIIFGIPEFAKTLNQVIDRYGIQTHFRHELVEVRGDRREAVFRVTAEDGSTSDRVEPFDMLHVTPPQSPPEVVRTSPLASETGWVDVDRDTLRHVRYPNVFSLGDASGSPNAKTGAAIRKQAPVVAKNLLALRKGGELTRPAVYDGYASCPLITGYGKLVLAEFDYANRPTPSFPFDTTKERYSMWLLKKDVLPLLYWHGMLRGRA